jgi:uncharacterized protein YecE (DUF72 family)
MAVFSSRPRDETIRRNGPALCIGCSGWNYKTWRKTFYPADLPPSRWLQYYSEQFDTVEANGTFYRLPDVSTFKAWREQTPGSFVMAVKASRFLTHMKRLMNPEEPLKRLFSRASTLGPRLGPVLYQLPPTMRCDALRLREFLGCLPARWDGRRLRHVMEFRHPSWYVPEIFRMLERHRVTLCLHDKVHSRIAEPVVGPLIYVRFHGTTGQYRGSYGSRQLEGWAQRLAAEWRAGRPVYAYFNNDPEAVATRNAKSLRVRTLALM